MSLPRYIHNISVPDSGHQGVETGISINAFMLEKSTVNNVDHAYFNATSGQPTTFQGTMDTTPNYQGATARTATWRPATSLISLSETKAEWYQGSKRFKYTNFFNRTLYDKVVDWIRENTIYNHTGHLYFGQNPDYADIKQAMYNNNNNGSFMSAGWLVADLHANLVQREYDADHDCYLITLGVDFQINVMHWDGTKWVMESGGGYVITFNGGSYGELEKVLLALEKAYNEMGKMYSTLSPYFSTTFFSDSGKSYMRIPSMTTGYGYVTMYENPRDMGNLKQTSKYFIYGGANSSAGFWTEDGTVDPTDPGETPTPIPPGPDEPDPPNPPIDPPDIPPSEIILPPDLPPINASSNGFFTAWNPSIVTLRLIGDKLWSSNIIQQFLNSIFSPMDTILGLGVIPVQPTTQSGDNITVHFGFVDSEVKAPMITSDYVRVDCGSVYLTPYYADYLDYEPYTKMSLFIPYVGEFDLNPDEVTGKTLRILCAVNVLTGDLIATVLANGSVIYQAAGNCMRSLPVTSGDLTQIVQAGVAAAGIIAGAALGGAAAAGAAPIGASNALAAQAGGYASTGEAAGAAMGNAMSSQTLGASASSVMGAKMHYHRAGQMGTGAGQLGNRKPFITILRPNLMLPDGAGDTGQNSDLKAYKGYPCNQIMPLTNATGMTVVEDCRLSIPGATEEEVAEALAIMKGGYIA